MKVKGRTCGKCSMCCHLLDIPELSKPANRWCEYCKPGHGGCGVYETRPEVCEKFKCLWLEGWLTQDYWQPQKARMVAFGSTDDGVPVLKIQVDAQQPNRWREEPYWSQIRGTSLWGLRQQPKRLVVVFVGRSKFLVLGSNIVENPPDAGQLVQRGPDDWAFVAAPVASQVAASPAAAIGA